MGLTDRPLLEQRVTGSGRPVTVAAHGLGATIAETRPLLSGVVGTKAFYSARGHGASDLPDEPYDYAVLGRDLQRVADDVGATQALGVSMGAGALLSLLARVPDRFERVVLFLPGAVDRPRSDAAVARLSALAAAVESGSRADVEREVLAELPADLRGLPPVRAWVRDRAAHLQASSGVPVALRALPASAPVDDASRLAAVTADVLLLAQEDDPLHPAALARDLAAVLPRARLVVFEQPGVVFRERARLRELVSGFLAAAD